ncbi:MAG: hypothetical protein IPP66_14220 [Anaerolineales bacterium]|nr:hypothetical protein [Anaerolineales bacterium]
MDCQLTSSRGNKGGIVFKHIDRSIIIFLIVLILLFDSGCIAQTLSKATPFIPTQTQIPNSELSNCIQVDSQLPHLDDMGGLLLYDPYSRYPKNVILMNTSDRSIIALGNTDEGLSDLRVSPNREWIAYGKLNESITNGIKSNLVVENFSTGTKIESPWHNDWELDGLKTWLNNKDLLITLESQNYPPDFIALNPFTGEITPLPSLFPDQVIRSPDLYVPFADYDPTLNYVIYPALEDNVYGFSLFDRTGNKQIAFSPSLSIVDIGAPEWSDDGQQYAFVAETKSGAYVHTGKLDGNVDATANLGEVLQSILVDKLSWSPDNKYIALVAYSISQQTEKLLLVDLAKQKIIDPCIKVNYKNWSVVDSKFPVWSPDGQMLLVENQTELGKNEVILIDVSKMTAGIFARDVRVLGWISIKP